MASEMVVSVTRAGSSHFPERGIDLQSFPRDYAFVPPDGEVRIKALGRLIGNAVPVDLGRAIARSINTHLASVAAR
ncbi:MAG: DNA cytosine methyltransferase [Candidatus Accumulibacter propinquus]|jgi:site-specific DNA-cytosine methylase